MLHFVAFIANQRNVAIITTKGRETMIMMLKPLREAKNMTQQEIAEYLGVSRQAYNFYETGKRSPDYETLLKLGELFDVSVEYLLRGDIYSGQLEKLNKPTEIGYDDFTYALLEETEKLTDEKKEALLNMARLLSNDMEKEGK